MTKLETCWILIATVLVWPTPRVEAQTSDKTTVVEAKSGTVMFNVATNVSAISVHGRSQRLDARARVRQGPEGMIVEQVDAIVPVTSLATGMGLRDEHMRKYIFTTPDGLRPDVRFTADRATCSNGRTGQTTICEVAGDLTIRGMQRPLTISLEVSGERTIFRVVGEAIVKLSAYGIEPPSQLGVRTADDVVLRLEFMAGPVVQLTADSGGER
jgi:polyisoprenoid-binding protein YceI